MKFLLLGNGKSIKSIIKFINYNKDEYIQAVFDFEYKSKYKLIDENLLDLTNIDYVIKDNIDSELDVEVTINGSAYQGEELIDLKEYTLVITAVDKSGNKTVKEINFEIVEENFFGCIDGFDCEENNYAVGIIIGIIIVVIVGVVVTLEIFYIKKKKKEQEYLEE